MANGADYHQHQNEPSPSREGPSFQVSVFCLDNEKKVLFTFNSALFFIYITVCFCFVSALNKKRREVIRTLVLFRNFSGNKQQPKITCLKLEIDVSLKNRQINT